MSVPLRHLSTRRFGTIALEAAVFTSCVLAVFYFQAALSVSGPAADYLLVGKTLLLALIFQFFLYLRDVYDFDKNISIAFLVGRLIQAGLLLACTVLILYCLFPRLFSGSEIVVVSLPLIPSLAVFWHTSLRQYLRRRKPRSNVLILGTGQLAKEVANQVLRKPGLGLRVCGFLGEEASLVGKSIVNPKVLGLFTDLPRIVSGNSVDRIVVELKDRRTRLPVEELLTMRTKGVAIEDATTFYERLTGKIAIENLKPSWMIFNEGFEFSRRLLVTKWIVSALTSVLLLILLAPVMFIVAVLVKLESRGPVFVRQTRVGKNGSTFTLYKFRSMYEDAERDTGPVWSTPDDSRVTRIGTVLRRTRLDELPQLWNVLKGEMSLVGPRPERPKFVEELTKVIPFYHLRLAVKPGVTGWAQVNYGYANSVQDAVEKLQYDLFYIKHMSCFLDLLIVFETVKTVLVRRGS
jgi:sugar transferase (PEP-CTERM system associated)